MRIAYVCADPGVPVFGSKGCSVHVQELVRAFRTIGAEVALFASRLGGEAPDDLNDVPVYNLPAIATADVADRERVAVQANRILAAELDRAGEFDLVFERYSLWSFAAMRFARAAGIPGVLEVNAPLIDEQAANRGLVKRRMAERIVKRVFNSADVVVAVSEPVAAYVQQFRAKSSSVHVIPNGVTPDRFSVSSIQKQNSGKPITIGFVGSLKPWHGLPVLVQSFAKFHESFGNSRLVIIGDGPERSASEAALARRGLLSCADLVGAVAPFEVPTLLNEIDIAVAPYPATTNFYFSPLKVVEYMAAGRAIVASRIGQIEQMIEDGSTGLLVPPGDAGAFAEAFERLARDPELRAHLGQAARASVSGNHSWNRIAQRVLNLAGCATAEV
jgi:glycosyltransferase involved in cell wall biosynthesis